MHKTLSRRGTHAASIALKPSRLLCVSLLALALLSPLAAQEDSAEASGEREETSAQALPASYRGVALGMSLEDVKAALLKETIFGYRGDRDVSFIPGGERQLIETTGNSFIRNAWFQFYDGKLYNMSFALDSGRIDYFTLFSSLTEKYGEPQELSPSSAVWLSDAVRLSLERPLTIKYIDAAAFSSILNADFDSRATESILRESFISDF